MTDLHQDHRDRHGAAGFGDDLAAMPDPTSAGTNLFQNTIISIHGDTPKNSLVNAGWPDGTANGTNYTYTYGAGYLKTGWFGNLDRTGKVTLWDPVTGADSTATGLTSKMLGGPAASVVLSAICKLDNDLVRTLVPNGVPQIVQMKQMQERTFRGLGFAPPRAPRRRLHLNDESYRVCCGGEAASASRPRLRSAPGKNTSRATRS